MLDNDDIMPAFTLVKCVPFLRLHDARTARFSTCTFGKPAVQVHLEFATWLHVPFVCSDACLHPCCVKDACIAHTLFSL